MFKTENEIHIKNEDIPEALGQKAKELYDDLIIDLKKEKDRLIPETFMDMLNASALKYMFGTDHASFGLRSYDFNRKYRLIISDGNDMAIEIEAQELSDIIKKIDAKRFTETAEHLKWNVENHTIPEMSEMIVHQNLSGQNVPNGMIMETTYAVTNNGRQFVFQQDEHFDQNGDHAFWTQTVSEEARVIDPASLTLEYEIGYPCIQDLNENHKVSYWITNRTKEIARSSVKLKNDVWTIDGTDAFKNRFSGKIDAVVDKPSMGEIKRDIYFLKMRCPDGFDQELKDRLFQTKGSEFFQVQIPENSFIEFEEAVKTKQSHFYKVKQTENFPKDNETKEDQDEKE